MVSSAAATQPAIAGYRDLRLIGSGGFSKVYTAYQERFARTVAVKVITVELSDDALRRFRREQLTAGQLDGHPHVIRVYESGTTDDGLPYLTMEYHEQGSLADRVRRHGPLPVAEVLSIGVKLACALDAAHQRGIVHRDVKPQNVLVSPFVGPILADFGIAAFEDARLQTVTSEAFSVFHVAPEVLDGHPATPAADLYALVSTLYELLAGRAPFASESPRVGSPGVGGPAIGSPAVPSDGGGLLQYMRRVRTAPVPPIDRADVPPGLVDELVALMAREPDGRPVSGAALAERLQAVEAGLGLPPTPLVGFGPTLAPSATVDVAPGPLVEAPPLADPPVPSPSGESWAPGSQVESSPQVESAETTSDDTRPGPRQAWVGEPGSVRASEPTPHVSTPVAPRHDFAPPPGNVPPGRPPLGPLPGEATAPPTADFRPPAPRPAPPPTDDGSRLGLWLGLGGGAVAVLLLAVGVWALLVRDDGSGGGERPRGQTTTTADASATGALPPCPERVTGDLPQGAAFGQGVPPTRLEVEVSGDGTAATVRWDDPNAGRSPYLVYASCDAPETDDRVAVAYVAAGEATEVTVESLPLEHNYCFTVGVLQPTGTDAVAYTAPDGTHFRCLDQTTR